MGDLVSYRTDHGVALLTLSDPPVNSCTHEMLSDLDAAIIEARFDTDIQVIVLTGHGDHYFCAGANINMLREVDPEFRYNFFLFASETLKRLENTPKLVIAALNGHAAGGGLDLALACDIRVARRDHGTIGLPEIRLGLLPGSGATQRLARFVGKGRAMQMLLSGDKIDFAEAASLGLINHVWGASSHTEFTQLVLDYAHRFTAPEQPSLAIGRLKRAVQLAYDGSAELAIAAEREMLAQLCGSADVAEGLAAWIEKRAPTFQSR